MKLQRQESNDKMNELIREFKLFATHMVENNQKAIIEALQQVIKDFNQNLTDQFGENFKQLNSAVEKLVVWQVEYKSELEAIKSSQQQTANDLMVVSQHFTEMVKKAEHFSQISQDLHNQLQLMEQQKDTLYQQEKSLAEVLTTMKDVTPEFATKVDAMLKEITAGVASVQSEMATSVKNLGIQFQSSNAEMKTLLTETIKKSQEDVSASLKEQVGTIKEGVITLDKVMQKELNDAIETMGRQLASLSSKFVEDYTPLTERLKAVVSIARGV
jgi:DNA anti-recombination protein RmuC